MAAFGKIPRIVAALRQRAGAAMPRFSSKAQTPAPAENAPLFHSFDPTTALFPGEAADDERAGNLPLATMLEESAHAMARRKEELREQARNLVARIGERRDGELTLAAQAVRVLIGLGWAGVAGWLYLGVLNARAAGISITGGGVPIDDATVLVRTFMIVAMAGLGVAFLVAALTRGLGNADNRRIATEAEKLGASIARASDEFDAALTGLRSAMDQRGRPADAVDELARAHVTALEAHDFFREINFLSGDENEHARRKFSSFLARAAGGGGGFPAFAAFLIGVISGAAGIFALAIPKPDPAAASAVETSALAIMQYPWAAQLILLGGIAYAGAGAALSLLSAPLTEGVAEKARNEALTALRSGFAAHSALRPADITRRIRDAVDVFRARVGGGVGGRTQNASPDHGANHSADFSAAGDVPEWRRRDSSVKFVDAGFSPAPESWRTDAYAKKFEAPGPGKSGSKRGGEGLKNRPRD